MRACYLFKNQSMNQTANRDFVLKPDFRRDQAVVITSAGVCFFCAEDEVSSLFTVAIEIAMPTTNPFFVVARRHIEGTVDRADHLDQFMAPSVGHQPVVVLTTMGLPKLGDYFTLSQFFWHCLDQLRKSVFRRRNDADADCAKR